ncbi:type II CAAX prenyl endopeptidase Rce1 family protein [Roseivirga sp. E12]|uniref:CPBP family glutamic-type intramembrane protease n=1 Tax=Roseivirga sp. E12 TaxID=2819237 RepID=UPI001ABBF572|nr:CPBP family glutamic-type intramembrane protease [Roseivirga sp. E12]MBO3699042.1 CPBP family intramembrane metalloprotease [Roseivirga sp. E12]
MKAINLTKLVITVFLISWLGVIPSLLIAYNIQIPSALKSLDILMTLGPLLGASIFIYRSGGKTGLKSFFKRLLLVRVNIKTIAVAVMAPLIITILASFVGFKLSTTSWPESFNIGSIVSNALAFFVMYLIVNTEELAWRGVVFDKLFDEHGYFKACLIIIPIWWLFHMPLFLFPNGHQAGYGLIEFTIIVISQSFILGWIYIQGKRSLLYVHLHHQLINGLGQAFPIFPVLIGGNMLPFWSFCTLMALLALLVIFNAKTQPNKFKKLK